MLILTQDKSIVVNLGNITQIYCIRYDESNVDIACCFNRGGRNTRKVLFYRTLQRDNARHFIQIKYSYLK